MEVRHIKDMVDSEISLLSELMFIAADKRLTLNLQFIKSAAQAGKVCQQDVIGFFDFCKQYHKSNIIPDFYYSATIRGKIAHVFHYVWYFMRGCK